MRGRTRDGRQGDRGVVAVASVFFVLMLLTFLALAINVGRIVKTRGNLQSAADSAALAAAARMNLLGDVVSGTVTEANNWTRSYRLTTGAQTDTVLNTDLRWGFWHHKTETCIFGGGSCTGNTFEASPLTSGWRQLTLNAVEVTSRYQLPGVFSGVMSLGSTSMTATSVAINRRSRVGCALPVAMPYCRRADDTTGYPNAGAPTYTGGLPNGGAFLFDPSTNNGEFNCSGGPKLVTFTSGVLNTTTPASDLYSMGRLDLMNKQDQDWNDLGITARNFVRHHTFYNDVECQTDPVYTAGWFDMPDDTRQNLEPFVDGLLGIPIQSGGQVPGACMLGQKRVVPVVMTDDTCSGAWPTVSSGLVVGYVNVIFRSITCTTAGTPYGGTPTINELNCNGHALANACSGEIPGLAVSGSLRVVAEIYCDEPTGPAVPPATAGPDGDRTQAMRPRLVR